MHEESIKLLESRLALLRAEATGIEAAIAVLRRGARASTPSLGELPTEPGETPQAIAARIASMDAYRNANTVLAYMNFGAEFAADIFVQQALRDGKAGVLLVAGGQGSRLGCDKPKSMYPIGPLSGATLLQIHCEKILVMGRDLFRPFSPH